VNGVREDERDDNSLHGWNTKESGRRGAFVRNEKYGNPGTLENRRKGGLVSQQRRGLHPELYPHCNLRRVILKPENSPNLAEFIIHRYCFGRRRD
jgi:hypothetical protein